MGKKLALLSALERVERRALWLATRNLGSRFMRVIPSDIYSEHSQHGTSFIRRQPSAVFLKSKRGTKGRRACRWLDDAAILRARRTASFI